MVFKPMTSVAPLSMAEVVGSSSIEADRIIQVSIKSNESKFARINSLRARSIDPIPE